jgi:SAM-dependent methyltransferase
MNWKLKANALALLSMMPGGTLLYLTLQKYLKTDQLDPEEGIQRALEIVRLIQETGRSPKHATVLEIGTGWRPYLPFLLYLAGAARVITFDINPWLRTANAFETYRNLEGHLDYVAQQLSEEPGKVRARFNQVPRTLARLRDLLQAFHVEYRCPADASHTRLADNSIDFVCSSNVLAHIPPGQLTSIHAEAARVLRPGGLAVHRIGSLDLFSIVDQSITKANFLQFSEHQWRRYGGKGLASHNRLRCVQHAELLRKAGFAIHVDRVRVDRRSLDAIKNGTLPVHRDFAHLSPEELAAWYMWLVGIKPAASHAPGPPASFQGRISGEICASKLQSKTKES